MKLWYKKHPQNLFLKYISCLHKMYILYHLPWIAKYISTLDETLRTSTQLISIFSQIHCARLLVLWTYSYATCACNIVHENMYMYIIIYYNIVSLLVHLETSPFSRRAAILDSYGSRVLGGIFIVPHVL